jgi:hypothetical protein
MVNVRPKRFTVSAGPFRLRRRYATGSNLKRAQKETVKLLCIVGIISALCQKYTVYAPSGRLASAWRVSASSASAHAKWYPIPVALGALVLVFFRYKRRMDSKEVHVDENGEEVVRLRGPWQVRPSSFGSSSPRCSNGPRNARSLHSRAYMRTCAVIGPCSGCLAAPEPLTAVGIPQLTRTAGLAETLRF